MKGKKKLSDIMIDAKYTLIQKKNQLVLDNCGDIAVMLGSRVSEDYKLSKTTQKILSIKIFLA